MHGRAFRPAAEKIAEASTEPSAAGQATEVA